MNLYSFLNIGAKLAPSDADRKNAAINTAAEKTRAQWLNALLVDQTRAWMSLGETADEVLTAMSTMLTIAGFASVYDTRDTDTPDIRIIRGAISAAIQCKQAGSVMQVEHAQAFQSACERATAIVQAASHDAIIHAAKSIRQTIGLPTT